MDTPASTRCLTGPSSISSPLCQFFLQQELVSESELHLLLSASQDRAGPCLATLIEGLQLQPREVAIAMGKYASLPVLDLNALNLQNCPIESIAEKLIRRCQCLPIAERGKTLFVAVADATNQQLLGDIEFHTAKQVSRIVVAQDILTQSIARVLNQSQLFDVDARELETLGRQQQSGAAPDDKIADKPLVRFLNRLLAEANNRGASDIHFEPYEHYYRVRLRRDGFLQEVVRPPINIGSRIAARLKVMASLDIAEKRLPQDGRIQLLDKQGERLDFRLSSIPILRGEKLVLRNLSGMKKAYSLSDLGMNPEQLAALKSALANSQGLILVTGPTGSGKTQTLYASLEQLNSPQRNIASAEDPVEYQLDGINQVAIDRAIGLDFARVLRALLRQDPDVLMVGEIRDAETAGIAIKAAQTGHLVLSSLHTNNAAQALTRLQNMGIADYNLAGSLSLIIAQRLLRRLCPHCKESEWLPENVSRENGFPAPIPAKLEVFRAVGCERCHQGYLGRIGIYEVVPVSQALSRRIMLDGCQAAIAKLEQDPDFSNLRLSALAKVRAGITSLEEANRLT